MLYVEDPDSAFPMLSLDVDTALEAATLGYFVACDPNNRPSRSFSLSLQQAKGDPEDWANPQGNFAIERLSSLAGGVIERKIMRGG